MLTLAPLPSPPDLWVQTVPMRSVVKLPCMRKDRKVRNQTSRPLLHRASPHGMVTAKFAAPRTLRSSRQDGAGKPNLEALLIPTSREMTVEPNLAHSHPPGHVTGEPNIEPNFRQATREPNSESLTPSPPPYHRAGLRRAHAASARPHIGRRPVLFPHGLRSRRAQDTGEYMNPLIHKCASR
jgi:hypothetical protein